ncbi:MAG: acetate--CoA ligase family protein [Nitrospinae bacterium]|nr:acetate--CoA ligase family protein [Nitrospinota bacterium]MBL7019313.1 acetate--CoA ligase family protein [Nitrospinaceae bacterium]
MNETATMNARFSSAEKLLEPFFAPKGVAIIGAGAKPGNQGKRIVDSLIAQGYEGRLIAVHPDGESLGSCPSVRSVQEIPPDINLAIAAVSAERVEALIEPLADHGIYHLIVVSGGFSESGPEGELRQNSLKDTANKLGMRIMGPNCLGTFSSADKFNSLFLSADDIRLPGIGSVAVISQSGAFLSAILDQLASRDIGVHRAINFGNRIDVGECEALEAFARDPKVKVIGVYLESVQNGQRFFEIVRRTAAVKPVVIYKGGKGVKGGRATQAHSASLAGEYPVFQAVCRQTGMIEVKGLNELINALQLLQSGPVAKGNRVLIVSNGGGMGVLLTDLLEEGNCDVVGTPLQIQEELKNILPGYYSFGNPVDLTGSGTNEQCVLAIDKILKTGLYDCLLLVVLGGTEGINADIAKRLREVLPRDLPVVLGAYGRNMFLPLSTAFINEKIPVFPTGEEAAWAVNLITRLTAKKAKEIPVSGKRVFHLLSAYEGRLSPPLDEMLIKSFLRECKIRVPENFRITRPEDLDQAVEEIGFPLVLKAVASDLLHKTELYAVELNLNDKQELKRKWQMMNQVWPGQVWVEEQMPPGLDLMLGMCRDATFGPLLLFGTGGSYVEIFKDIERILLPATDEEILASILRTKAGQIIQGVRGQPPLALASLMEFMKWMTQWVEEETRLVSLDFNPVRLYTDSLVVLDAKAEMKLLP